MESRSLRRSGIGINPLISGGCAEASAGVARIERHAALTGSSKAAAVLSDWDHTLPKFVKVMPKDYKRVLEALKRVEQSGLTGEQAIMAAFEENVRDQSRVGGG